MATATATDGKGKATFTELKQAVMTFCDSHCEIPNVSMLDCLGECPLYPFRMGAVEVK